MGRDEELEYAKAHGIPVRQTVEKPYSWDDNMWGVTGEGGEIENPALIPPLEKILTVCTDPVKAPDQPELLELEFVKGIPVSVNGREMKLSDVIGELNTVGARHGVGITHHVEDRVVGLKVRGLYEAPAAEIIVTAHRNLEKVNEKVTGKVTMRLYKGVAEPVAMETPNTIFEEKLATFMASNAFNQNASPGFIELYTFQMRLAQRAERTVLLSIGKRQNKLKLLPEMQAFSRMKYKIYATYKTHKFLRANGIEAILVNKISQPHLKPNLYDLLKQNRFDLIINIPSGRKEKEISDGSTIRQMAIRNRAVLVTDVRVAKQLVDKLQAH
jgi:argininosuccinate synthase